MKARRIPVMSRTASRTKRLLGVQLRLKVMAGVVIVALLALAAFDLGAVSTMRRYLLAQTDSDLHGALVLTAPRLPAILAAGAQRPSPHGPPAEVARPRGTRVPSLPGAFDITFVPLRGPQVALQINAAARGRTSVLPRWVASRAGPATVLARGQTPLRFQSIHVHGGSLVAGTSLSQVTRTIDQVELIVVLGSVAVILLIGLGVFAVLRRGLRPIEAMARQADRISGGDLTDRVTAHDPRSEVGRLGAALNEMLARIEADVHEREASQLQTRRFFADASHELRTPLASLRANAELYQQGALGTPDDLDEVMDRIASETRRMGRLVDDMLRLARLGQAPGQSRQPVDVTAVVTGCADRVRVADPARAWQVRVDAGLATVGDEDLIRRAVDNLLMNVLVHAPGEAAGSITAARDDDLVVIEVSDDGPGVPPDKLPHIFERFYRAGAGSDRPGAGLGLAIAAEIASTHGGTARAAAAGPRGLRITLALPVSGPARPRVGRELAAAAPDLINSPAGRTGGRSTRRLAHDTTLPICRYTDSSAGTTS
jgi:two-component system, OmpR family, sensor kinase